MIPELRDLSCEERLKMRLNNPRDKEAKRRYQTEVSKISNGYDNIDKNTFFTHER